MVTPADIAAIAEATYHELGPILGTHSPCRLFMAIAAGVARALGMPYEAVYEGDYEEAGQHTCHYWLELGGQRLDLWDRQVRLR